MSKLVGGAFDFSPVSFVDHNWSTALFLVALLLLTVNAVLYRRKFVLSLQCLFSKRAFSQLSKEGKFFGEGTFIFSLPFILLAISLCIRQLCVHFFPLLFQDQPFMRSLGIICLAVILFFLLKLVLNYFLLGVFDCSEERDLFHVLGFSFWLNSSLMLLLSEVIVQYTDFYAFYLFSLLIISGLFVLKVYKNYVFKSVKVNLFQFFMYFCTLEILPYAVIVKLLFLYGNKGF
ncbi:MAG: DUF4271 domain-containing protein [Bacteroidales bacterium]|nr:DUF4271 domain-containing protein [Bacteroidales bacterium]